MWMLVRAPSHTLKHIDMSYPPYSFDGYASLNIPILQAQPPGTFGFTT